MILHEQKFITLQDNTNAFVECIKKDYPRYTYQHSYHITAMNDKNKGNNELAMEILHILGYDKVYPKSVYPGELSTCFAPWYVIENERVNTSHRSFNITITFPYDD